MDTRKATIITAYTPPCAIYPLWSFCTTSPTLIVNLAPTPVKEWTQNGGISSGDLQRTFSFARHTTPFRHVHSPIGQESWISREVNTLGASGSFDLMTWLCSFLDLGEKLHGFIRRGSPSFAILLPSPEKVLQTHPPARHPLCCTRILDDDVRKRTDADSPACRAFHVVCIWRDWRECGVECLDQVCSLHRDASDPCITFF